MKNFLICMLSVFVLSGCSTFGRTMKAFVGGEPTPEKELTNNQATSSENANSGVTYSQKSNVPAYTERNYQRMSKDDFENEYLSKDRDGSLWVMEGQDSYLFSQNIVRLPGDIFNVVLDGQPHKQLSTKVGVIRELSEAAKRKPAAVQAAPAIPILGDQSTGGLTAAAAAQAPPPVAEKTEKPNLEQFDVNQIPVRIVDRSIDGSYRVKGSQVFMIGKDEYKVIVSGLVRPSDVADGGVAASKIIDSKFDIVRSRKRGI